MPITYWWSDISIKEALGVLFPFFLYIVKGTKKHPVNCAKLRPAASTTVLDTYEKKTQLELSLSYLLCATVFNTQLPPPVLCPKRAYPMSIDIFSKYAFFFFLLYAILLSLGSSEYSLDKYHLLGWIVLKSSVNSTVCLSIYPSKFYFQIISCLATDWSLWTNGCLYLLRRHEIHVCPFLKPIMCY